MSYLSYLKSRNITFLSPTNDDLFTHFTSMQNPRKFSMFFFVITDLPIHLNTNYLIYLSMHPSIHLTDMLYFFYAS